MGIPSDFPMKRKRKTKLMTNQESEDVGQLILPYHEFERQCNMVFDSILGQMKIFYEWGRVPILSLAPGVILPCYGPGPDHSKPFKTVQNGS